MFGRDKKKQLKENDTMIMNQPMSEDDYPINPGDVVRQGFQQQQGLQQQMPPQMPQYQQQVQPMVQPQSIQQPIQQQRQFNQPKAEAVIIEGKMSEGGDYFYVVKANYPLSLGYCNLSQ